MKRRSGATPTAILLGNHENVSPNKQLRKSIKSWLRRKIRGGPFVMMISFLLLLMISIHILGNHVVEPPTLQQQEESSPLLPRRLVPRVVAIQDEYYGNVIALPHHVTAEDLLNDDSNNTTTHETPPDVPLDEEEEADDCVPMHAWQTSQFPSCNMIHEMISSPQELRYVNRGSQSIVFQVPSSLEEDGLILKSQRYDKAHYTPKGYRQRRQDAVIQERLTASPYVASIYGYCAMSVLSPLAPGGLSLFDFIDSVRGGGQQVSSLDKLRIGVQLSEGLAALHDIDHDGIPSFSHNDLDISQHVYLDGVFQLNDFNYGRMLMHNSTTTDNKNETCKDKSRMSGWKYRAPEDLAYIYHTPQGGPFLMDRADVFSLGTELYMLLTNLWIWEEETREKAAHRIIDGERPPLPEHVVEKSRHDEAIHALITAINMCWIQDPEKRATAREVATFLMKELRRLENGKTGDGGDDSNKKGDGIVRVKMPPLVPGPDDYDKLM